ncbi:hypothetical protein [Microcoleus sp. S13C4]|uniref:hypothetical protein n=1 Tax=Microcoleus sp. S13C4 TaxID=3055410 RepID=UPI002FCEC5A2
MAAFTVTKSPGFCMVGDRLFLEEGRRKREEGRRKREEGRRKKEEGRRKREEGRRKKEEGIKNVVTLKTVPTTYN